MKIFLVLLMIPFYSFGDELCANVITSYDSKKSRHHFYVERTSARMHNSITIIPISDDIAKLLETQRSTVQYFCFQGTSLFEDFETIGSETWYVRSITETKPAIKEAGHN